MGAGSVSSRCCRLIWVSSAELAKDSGLVDTIWPHWEEHVYVSNVSGRPNPVTPGKIGMGKSISANVTPGEDAVVAGIGWLAIMGSDHHAYFNGASGTHDLWGPEIGEVGDWTSVVSEDTADIVCKVDVVE